MEDPFNMGDMDGLMNTFSHMLYKIVKERGQSTAKKAAPPCASDFTETGLAEQVEQFRKANVYGKTFIVCRLKDETGRQLNGERCKVVGFDYKKGTWNGRYHGEILTGQKKGKLFGLKYMNLADPAAAVLLSMVQPSPPDLFDPADFLINMILAWTSTRYNVPPAPIDDDHFQSPDAQLRALLVCRYIIHYANVSHYLEPMKNAGVDLNKIADDADLTGLVNRLEKRDPKFFQNDFSAYYLMDMRSKRFPEKADKAESHLLKKGGFTNVKKNKKRLAEALTMALQYIIIELSDMPKTMRSLRQLRPKELIAIEEHNVLLVVANNINVSQPLECGRMNANGLQDPALKDKLINKLETHENYFKYNTAIQATCYGDTTVDFRRFNFGLTGGSNLPHCSICIEAIEKSDLKVAKLDCQHIFHEDCIAEWFAGGRRTCPSCRESHVGLVSYDLSDHLQERFLRYIAWGICEKCQSFHWERKHRDFVDGNAFRL